MGGTGPAGIQATQRVSYLRSFVQFPDWIAFRSGATAGEPGLLSLGLFGPNWSLETGEKWQAKAEEEGF